MMSWEISPKALYSRRTACMSPVVDILPALRKGGDSLSRRSMSRTEEDIASGVDITIMRDTTLRNISSFLFRGLRHLSAPSSICKTNRLG